MTDAQVEPLSKELLAAPGTTAAPSKDSQEVGRGKALIGKQEQDPPVSPVSQPDEAANKKDELPGLLWKTWGE